MTRLDEAQDAFLKALQLREVAGDYARIHFATLGALIDCARAYIDGTEATESADYLNEQKDTESP